MRTCDHEPGFRSWPGLILSGAALMLAAAGCQSPAAGPGQAAARPNFGPPMQDVQTEATVAQMENEYIAAKNSPPPRPEQAEAMKKMEQQRTDAAKAGKAPAQKAAKEPKPAPKPPPEPGPEPVK